ncbi:MAG: 16S rRNA processing protein RimM [Erysipelotrichia bacterium]|nr:16S rRNA processing protein RimM [Erysipelotrichia bacterium]
MTHQYLLIGYVVGPFSLDGTLKILSKTDFAEQRYHPGNSLILFDPKKERSTTVHVVNFRASGSFDFVKFAEINSPEDAIKFKRFEVRAKKDYSLLSDDSYFFDDLIGCEVINEAGEALGIVGVVEQFPAHITLRIKREKQKDFFVPFIQVFIRNVDIKQKIIEINVIEGML